MSKKIAVVLFNLGGPDNKAAIKPFLMNFFMDKNIITLPVFLRYFIARSIANKRSKREAGDSYAVLGNKSPLLKNTQAQAQALEERLKGTEDGDSIYKTFVTMRYWHPMAEQVVRAVRDWGADKIVILPLYPQFSTTTTWSSLEQWNKAMSEAGMSIPTSMACCYTDNVGYVEGSSQNIMEQYKKALKDGHEKIRVLFSAHGLPEKMIKGGDPYQYQCEESAQNIVNRLEEELGKDSVDWQICYQSRVGRLKWIEPSIEQAIDKAAEDKCAIIIYPHAFTQEHIETLVELDIEYKDYAEEKFQRGYYRAQTLGTQSDFIGGLVLMAMDYEMMDEGIYAQGGECTCPEQFGRCCMRMGCVGTDVRVAA